MLFVKIAKYIGFCLYRRSYLTWSPVREMRILYSRVYTRSARYVSSVSRFHFGFLKLCSRLAGSGPVIGDRGRKHFQVRHRRMLRDRFLHQVRTDRSCVGEGKKVTVDWGTGVASP